MWNLPLMSSIFVEKSGIVWKSGLSCTTEAEGVAACAALSVFI